MSLQECWHCQLDMSCAELCPCNLPRCIHRIDVEDIDITSYSQQIWYALFAGLCMQP
jgi:hypothetical protein